MDKDLFKRLDKPQLAIEYPHNDKVALVYSVKVRTVRVIKQPFKK